MSPREAADLLFPGLGLGNIDAGMIAEIKDAYRIFAKSDHPDQGGDGTKITSYKAARDALLDHVNGVKPACPVCNGKGVVKGNRFKPQPCPRGCKSKSHGATTQIGRATGTRRRL